MPKLEVRVSEEELARWREAAGSGSLSAWVRGACDRAVGVVAEGLTEPAVGVAGLRGVSAGSPGPATKVPEPDTPRSAVAKPSGPRPAVLARGLVGGRLSDERVAGMAREAGLCPPHPESARLLLGGGRARCRLCKAEYRL